MTKVLRVTALLAVACLTTMSLAQDRPLIAVYQFADNSCGAWVRSANSELNRAEYVDWFRGFVSGYNFGNAANQVPLGRMPDPQTLALYIDKHCRDKPLDLFTAAAFKLVEELREKPEPSEKKARR